MSNYQFGTTLIKHRLEIRKYDWEVLLRDYASSLPAAFAGTSIFSSALK